MPIEQLNATTYGFRMPCGDLVKVGDEALPNLFKPHLMLNRWDEECQVTLATSVLGLTQLRVPSDQLVEYETKDCLLQYHGKVGEDYKLGGFAVDQIIFKKPKTNVLIAPFFLNNTKAYYQPPLTQQEIDEGCIRPEKVVGSYALYHATRPPMHASKEIAEKYKACRVGMWYKPLIWDNATPKRYCWGELSIDIKTGLRAITIPKEFYETAIYPITIDDDFGYKTEGESQLLLSSGYIYGCQYLGAVGDGVSITWNIAQASTDTPTMKFGLYDADDNFVENSGTGEWTLTAGWNDEKTLAFGTAPSLTAQNYRIVIWGNARAWAYYDDGEIAQTKSAGFDYNGWPASTIWPEASWAYKLTVYCTYTPGGGPAAVMPWNLAPRMAMMTG